MIIQLLVVILVFSCEEVNSSSYSTILSPPSEGVENFFKPLLIFQKLAQMSLLKEALQDTGSWEVTTLSAFPRHFTHVHRLKKP